MSLLPLAEDGDGRDRRLPNGMAKALRVQSDSFDLRALNRLAGMFRDGYTPADAADVGARLERALGRAETLCVVWAFSDSWGPGGDSEGYLRSGSRLLPLPGALGDLLNEGRRLDRDEVVGSLALIDSAPASGTTDSLIEIDRFNLVRETR